METGNILNLRELVQGAGNGLRYVTRYSNCRTIHKENVAEHQYYTAFYALMLAEYVRLTNTVDVGVVLSRAIMHDFDEIWTGDVVRPVKHHNVKLSKQIESIGAQMYQEEFVYKTTGSVPMRSQLKRFRELAKASDTEGRIVKFADYLSVLSYLDQEIRSGNRLIMGNVTCLAEYTKEFVSKDFDFIRPLVDEAQKMVQELLAVKESTK